MSKNTKPQENILTTPVITVFGVGGAGGNAVNNMINANLQGAIFVAANTDAQALKHSLAQHSIQLGANTTRGLGAGASPDVGMTAAEESAEEIRDRLYGSNMVFITAGMGGGTGTGGAAVVARIAKELGILTVGVVTKPFHFEGQHRMMLAERGLTELQKCVDTLIVIPNQNLFRIANERTTFADAFKMADDVLHAGVRGVTDLMTMPGLINLDFADIRTVMSEMGKAMMGTGEASGDDRAIKAAEAAIANPLLDHCSMRGARGVLINITGGMDMTLFEVDAAANRIREEVGDNDANIIFGSTFSPNLDGVIRVSVVATGIEGSETPAVRATQTVQDTLSARNTNAKPAFSSTIYKGESNIEAANNPATWSTTPWNQTSPQSNVVANNKVMPAPLIPEERMPHTPVSSQHASVAHAPTKATTDRDDAQQQYNVASQASAQQLAFSLQGAAPTTNIAAAPKQATSKASLFTRVMSGMKYDRDDSETRTAPHAPEALEVTDLSDTSEVFDVPAFLRRR